MSFYADLHLHSHYAEATSKHSDLEHLSLWARKKGILMLGTGDFTHPVWMAELTEKLIPAEPGLFRLRPAIEKKIEKSLQVPETSPTRFMLEVEVSTIYRQGDKTRKIHHLVYVPDIKSAKAFSKRISPYGDLAIDGRPILKLDSRSLLEIVLSIPDAYLVPAHVWTPWYGVFGSKTGFDSIKEAYGDLTPNIFALETGLSSDPAMNWRLSTLDQFRMISYSDAHSPQKLGREATIFSIEPDYFKLRQALKTGDGLEGTLEFFPEEGKYHMDGHRACGVRLTPAETKANHGFCPVCGHYLTIGVANRIESLADRAQGKPAPFALPFTNIVPLAEIVSEIEDVGVSSKRVQGQYEQLLNTFGSEFSLLLNVPTKEIETKGYSKLAHALERMRLGKVTREAGYDGIFGKIKVLDSESPMHTHQ